MIPLGDTDLWNAATLFATEQRRQWNGLMHASALSEYQRENLRETISYARAQSPFYRQHLAGFSGSSPITSLPFTTKNDLRVHLDDVASRQLAESWIYYETTGTTGISTPCPRTSADSIRTGVALCEGYRDLLGSDDERLTIAVMGPTELHSTGDTFGDVFRSLGHASVKMWPHSPVVGFDRARELLRRLPITGLVCTPGMSILLARHLLANEIDPASLGIKIILTVGELATPHLLAQIAGVWSAKVHSSMYASQEASILAVCQRGNGLRTTPLNYYYEIIDPDTGECLDSNASVREGELVVTHLYRGAKPLIRYRTGDLIRANGSGQDFIVTPIGRAHDKLRVGDRTYVAYDFEDALLDGCPPFLDYQVDIYQRDGRDHVHLLLESRPIDSIRDDSSALAEAHARRLSDRMRVDVEVVWGTTDTRTSTGAMVSWKAARIRDHREDIDHAETASALRIARQRVSGGMR